MLGGNLIISLMGYHGCIPSPMCVCVFLLQCGANFLASLMSLVTGRFMCDIYINRVV